MTWPTCGSESLLPGAADAAKPGERSEVNPQTNGVTERWPPHSLSSPRAAHRMGLSSHREVGRRVPALFF